MLDGKILGLKSPDSIKARYGTEWDKMSKKEQEKLQKEEMDKEEIEKGKKAALAKLSDNDRDIINAMN